VNAGDSDAMLEVHGSFGVIVMHRQNGRTFRKRRLEGRYRELLPCTR